MPSWLTWLVEKPAGSSCSWHCALPHQSPLCHFAITHSILPLLAPQGSLARFGACLWTYYARTLRPNPRSEVLHPIEVERTARRRHHPRHRLGWTDRRHPYRGVVSLRRHSALSHVHGPIAQRPARVRATCGQIG